MHESEARHVRANLMKTAFELLVLDAAAGIENGPSFGYRRLLGENPCVQRAVYAAWCIQRIEGAPSGRVHSSTLH